MRSAAAKGCGPRGAGSSGGGGRALVRPTPAPTARGAGGSSARTLGIESADRAEGLTGASSSLTCGREVGRGGGSPSSPPFSLLPPSAILSLLLPPPPCLPPELSTQVPAISGTPGRTPGCQLPNAQGSQGPSLTSAVTAEAVTVPLGSLCVQRLPTITFLKKQKDLGFRTPPTPQAHFPVVLVGFLFPVVTAGNANSRAQETKR